MRELHKTDPLALQTGISMIGPQFQNAHHYCFGLNYLNRYYSAPVGARAKSNLSIAHNELTYMVEHLYPNSSLAGEIFLHRGIVNSLMKNDTEALLDLQQAISRKPTLVKAYLTLADYYSERKLRDKALPVVTEGLRYAPNSKGLRRRYQELGGKLPYPVPVVAQPEPEITVDKPAEVDAGTNAASPKVDAGDISARSATDKAADKETPNQGASNKPHCRFCPDEP